MNPDMRSQITLFAKVFGPFLLIGTFSFLLWVNYAFFSIQSLEVVQV